MSTPLPPKVILCSIRKSLVDSILNVLRRFGILKRCQVNQYSSTNVFISGSFLAVFSWCCTFRDAILLRFVVVARVRLPYSAILHAIACCTDGCIPRKSGPIHTSISVAVLSNGWHYRRRLSQKRRRKRANIVNEKQAERHVKSKSFNGRGNSPIPICCLATFKVKKTQFDSILEVIVLEHSLAIRYQCCSFVFIVSFQRFIADCLNDNSVYGFMAGADDKQNGRIEL